MQILPAHIQSTDIRKKKFYDYAGSVNIKSSKSTGSGSLNDIATAANAAGLDFIVLNDVNDFSPQLDRQGYLNSVLIFLGGDYGYLEGRILNFDFTNIDHLQGPGRSQSIFADILSEKIQNRAEGIFILAHPLKPGYNLSSTIPVGLDGIELMNLKDVWQRAWLNSPIAFLWNLLTYPFNSKLSYLRMLNSYGSKEISLWDKINRNSQIFGYYGSAAEANAKLNKNISLVFPSYETIFSIVRNHVLLKSELVGKADVDRKKISSALRSGQFYMSVDMLQNPKGFEAYVTNNKNEVYPLGSEFKYAPGTEFIVDLPDKPLVDFEVVIFKDGDRVLTSTSVQSRYEIHGPGVYRAIVRVRVPLPFPEKRQWINWITTNHIYVR